MAIAIQKYRARYKWKRYAIKTNTNLTYDIQSSSVDVTTPPYSDGWACKKYTIALNSSGRFYYFSPTTSKTESMQSWHGSCIAEKASGIKPNNVSYPYYRPSKNLTVLYIFTGDQDKYGRLFCTEMFLTTKTTTGDPSIGDFIDIVVSSNKYAYPDNGIFGDYWYVRI